VSDDRCHCPNRGGKPTDWIVSPPVTKRSENHNC
jgi:hypothetical protein